MKLLPMGLLALACATGAAGAGATEGGDWIANVRYRYEMVDDDAFARDADAHTARLRLGWKQAFDHGFSALVEMEGVAELGGDFNSGANGHVGWPVVPDARALEVNQAWLGWRNDHLGLTLGRQRILLDNQRFVGNSGWRQNEQTFDALAIDGKPADDLVLRYYLLDRVHRVAGDEARDPLARERRLRGHLGNAAWTTPAGLFVGYAYLVEDRDVATASTRTLGARWTGSRAVGQATFGGSLEWASQHDHGNNPRSYSASYWLVEPSLAWHGITWKGGWEHLGGNGVVAFQTPLATLHAFNGWADKFNVTPAAGLEDAYLSATGKFGRGVLADKLAWTLAWHDYQADHGGADYGQEWNASLAFPLPHGLTGMVKLADYRSDGFARDTTKFWLQVEWNH